MTQVHQGLKAVVIGSKGMDKRPHKVRSSTKITRIPGLFALSSSCSTKLSTQNNEGKRQHNHL